MPKTPERTKRYQKTAKYKAARLRYFLSPKGQRYLKHQRRQHYLRHRDRIHQQNQTRCAEQVEEINRIKAAPCEDCGHTFPPVCMDFDHVRGVKHFNVSKMLNGKTYAPETILDEIAKCDLVCACCHRIRTQTRSHLKH